LAASDHVFFEDTTAGGAKRSTGINLFPGADITLYLAFVIPGCARLGAGPESILTMVVMDSGLEAIEPRFARTRRSRPGMTHVLHK
jgi:hypothetical protein